ncbi:MAG: glycosyltransferase [Croceibacterium sp.]
MTPDNATSPLPRLIVMWENFGPTHHDRLRALARAGFEVDAIELSAASRAYEWDREDSATYHVQTLSQRYGGTHPAIVSWRLLKACLRSPARHVFLCHYSWMRVFVVAIALRLLGRRVYAMVDSKFDDYARILGREVFKSFVLSPYNGAIVASRRSLEYLAFLRAPRDHLVLGYDTIDTERVRQSAGPIDAAQPFAARPFLVVARLVAKKNIPFVLQAFARYRSLSTDPRELHLIGYGPLEDELKAEAGRLGLGEAVRFLGLKQAGEVAHAMSKAVALVLASTEEQFGLVINEALAVGLPVIVSSNAGAVDTLVENLGNGLIIDPYNPETLVLAMAHVASDGQRWEAMHRRALETAPRADAAEFVAGVTQLVTPVAAG